MKTIPNCYCTEDSHLFAQYWIGLIMLKPQQTFLPKLRIGMFVDFLKDHSNRFFRRVGLVTAKKTWSKPPKRDVLIYDRFRSAAVQSYFCPSITEILDERGEKLNMYILFRALLTHGKLSVDLYIDEYIKAVSPKVIITHYEQNSRFYLLKNRHPHIKFVAIQSDLRAATTFPFVISQKYLIEKAKCDALFAFNEVLGSYYKKVIQGPVISAGSLRANMFSSSKKAVEYDLCFISQFRDPKKNFEVPLLGRRIPYNIFFRKAESIILNFLEKYSAIKNLRFAVVGCSQDWKREEDYYRDILKNEFYFEKKISQFSSYEFLSKANVIVSIDSTLGGESLAIGHKTAIFAIRHFFIKEESYKFGWPAKMPDKGPFWTNEPNEDHFREILDYLFDVDDDEWDKTRIFHLKDVIEYDYGNSKFVDLMKSFGVKTKTPVLFDDK